jgi:hypothetical protein
MRIGLSSSTTAKVAGAERQALRVYRRLVNGKWLTELVVSGDMQSV